MEILLYRTGSEIRNANFLEMKVRYRSCVCELSPKNIFEASMSAVYIIFIQIFLFTPNKKGFLLQSIVHISHQLHFFSFHLLKSPWKQNPSHSRTTDERTDVVSQQCHHFQSLGFFSCLLYSARAGLHREKNLAIRIENSDLLLRFKRLKKLCIIKTKCRDFSFHF